MIHSQQARALVTQDKKKQNRTCMPLVRIKPMIPVFKYRNIPVLLKYLFVTHFIHRDSLKTWLGEKFLLVCSLPVHITKKKKGNNAKYVIHGHVIQIIINMRYELNCCQYNIK
jgi:hypothetical protein